MVEVLNISCYMDFCCICKSFKSSKVDFISEETQGKRMVCEDCKKIVDDVKTSVSKVCIKYTPDVFIECIKYITNEDK